MHAYIPKHGFASECKVFKFWVKRYVRAIFGEILELSETRRSSPKTSTHPFTPINFFKEG